MDNVLQLVLFSPHAATLDVLRRRISPEAGVVFVQGNAVDATARMPLDAMFVTPMMAYEFGINPPLPPHEAHVFPMPQQGLDRGLPRLLIAGVPLVPGRVYTPEYLGRVTIEALGQAVVSYNRERERPILRVAALPSVLGLEGPNSESALHALGRLFSVRKQSWERLTA